MSLDAETIASVRAWLLLRLQRSGPLPVPADDLVGEVILRLLLTEEDKEIRSPYAYAKAILQNLIRDQIRDLERARLVLAEVGAQAGEAGEAAAPAVLGDFENDELVACLLQRASLSALQEKVIRMIYLHGMPLADVARELSRNPGTILQHRDRALEKLARCAAQLGVEA